MPPGADTATATAAPSPPPPAPPSDRTERRTLAVASRPIEVRATDKPGPGMLVGYAAIFNSQSEPLPSWGGDFVEIIAPGAFNDAIQADDVRCLRDHQPGQLLGRTGAGTLRLSVDEIGLRYECDLPDTTHGRDTAFSVGRKDLAGNSFGFDVVEDEWDVRGPIPVRTLKRVKLYDVGPVTFPAYKGTSVDVRCLKAPAPEPTPPPPAPAETTPPPAPEPTPPARSAKVEAEIRARRLRLAEAGA